MKKITFLIIIVLFINNFHKASAQNCSEGLSLINQLWENFDPMSLVNDKNGVNKQVNNLKKELSSLVSLNLKKDAPRLLPVGTSSEKKINLKQNRKRIFVTTPLKKDAVILTISRPEISSQATVTICAHTLKGETKNLEKLTLNVNGRENIDIPINGYRGKILSINITNTGSSKITYKITAN